MTGAFWAAVSASAIGWGQEPSEPLAQPTLLREGEVLTATQRADERVRYVFDAGAGGTYLIELQQNGLDFVVTVEDPTGVSRSYNSPLLRDEREFVLLEAVAGPQVITVHSEEHTGAIAAHSIHVRAIRAADPNEVTAWRLETAGGASNFEAGEQGWAAAAMAYERAAELWGGLGHHRERARALYCVAAIEYWQRFNWDRAAELVQRAAELYAGLNEESLFANAVHLRAAALVEKALETRESTDSASATPEGQALFREAFTLLDQARQIHERLGRVYDLGLVINNIGYTHYYLGELDKARPHYQEAAALMRSVNAWTGELNPLANLALVEAEQGRLIAAIDTLERILKILPEGRSLRYRADTLDNLGNFEQRFGNADQALQHYSSALAIHRSIDDRKGEARALAGLGQTYFSLGELELANDYLQQALPLARETHTTQEGVLKNLGNLAFLDGDYAAALGFHERARTAATSDLERCRWETLIVKDLVALGRYEEATEIAAQLVAAAQRVGSEVLIADALHQYGRALTRRGETAVEHLEHALSIYTTLGLQLQQAETLHSLALNARRRGRLAEAVQYGARSLDGLENLRLRVADPELRAFSAAIHRDHYEAQIALLMTLHAESGQSTTEYLSAALEVSERARARMMVDLLQDASFGRAERAAPQTMEREEALYEQLAERRYQRDRLLEQPNPADAALVQVLGDLASLENELNLLDIEARTNSVGRSILKAPAILTARQMQEALDPQTVLLHYALGDEASYVWIVTRDDLRAVRLADRATIELAARKAFAQLKHLEPDPVLRRVLGNDLRALSELIVLPILSQITKETVLLSLDGALQYVPFGALPIRGADNTEKRFLEQYRVLAIPSMSVLLTQRARRPSERAGKALAVFADPVLERNDPRLGAVAQAVALDPEPDTLITRSSVDATLRRLPFTAQEAESISNLLPANERFVARGFDASRHTVLSTDLRQYRFIHFATHGLVDSRYPALSALALSQFDEQGVRQNGFLRLHDIYDLELNAELVVLSACETALGREVRGEGLLGLTQGFWYAGTDSLIVSLWQVSDRGTAELMARFYELLLVRGMRPADALRQAQLSLLSERTWREPYFWGGFVLLGDWR